MQVEDDVTLPEGRNVQFAGSLQARIGNFKVPRVLPDEHVFSWCGRMYRINDVDKTMSPGMSYRSFLPFKIEGLAELACLAGMDSEGLLRRHTMVPFVRAVVRDSTCVDSEGRRNVDSDLTPRLAVRWSSLRYCPDCVARDRRKRGFAYWRRMHQLPGVFWCPLHKSALIATSEKTTYAEEPGDQIAGEDASLGLWPSLSEVCPSVKAYIHMAIRTLRRPRPIGTSSMAIRLNALVLALQPTGLAVSGKALQLKNAVEGAFPIEWLAKVSPQRIGVGRGGVPAEWKSLLSVWPKPRATERYLIVAAALLPDEHMVSSIMFSPEHNHWIADADLPSAASRNWVLSAAMRLAKSIKSHMATPSLALQSSNLEPAFAQFLGGSSIEESCAAHQIDPKALQGFLRELLVKAVLTHERA